MAKRIRRTPDEARRVILDAAEAVMATEGPAGIRLADVAKAAGVSHPTVLHHFGSREGLIVALNRRTLEDLRVKLVALMRGEDKNSDSAVASTFAAYRGGLAQRIVWLMQQSALPPPQNVPMFKEMVERFHALRVKFASPGITADAYDSYAIVHLMTLVGFADAIMGARLRGASGEKQEKIQREKFEAWFGALMDDFIRRAATGK